MGQPSKEYKAAWYQRNKERLRLMREQRHSVNKDIRRKALATYKARNPSVIRAIQTRWRKKNSAYHAAKCAERHARKLQATPKWAIKFFIEEAYRLAALRTKIFGFRWHVDHIVPLQSKIVCGLHTHHNIQVIPGRDNQSKNNRRWPGMA